MSNMDKLAKELKTMITASHDRKPKPYDTQAEVLRVEDGIAWVHIPGGVQETPVRLSMDAKKGDVVNVHVANGSAWITGNNTNPPTDDTTANYAQATATKAIEIGETAIQDAERAYEAANRAESDAERAHDAADAAEGHAQTALTNAGIAQTSADSALVSLATVEDVVGVLNWITAHGNMVPNGTTALDPSKVYFVVDTNGDYEVSGTHYSIVAEPKAEDRNTYYTLSVDESVQNYVATHVCVNTEGMWLIPDQNGTPTTNGKKILIATGAGTYSAGTYIIDRSSGTDKVIASFRADGATIGENSNGKTRTNINANGMQVIRKDSGNDIELANIGYGSGTGESGNTHTAPYYTFGERNTTFPAYDATKRYSIGRLITVPNYANVKAVCIKNTPDPAGAFDWDYWQSLYYGIGNYSVAEGLNSIASGLCSHAEGEAIARGEYSHAEGKSNVVNVDNVKVDLPMALGTASHCEGVCTMALGTGSHAEGNYAHANGEYSHAEGHNTYADGNYSHAEGDTTHAIGKNSHAEGHLTYANGDYSHAEGYRSQADGDYSHARGNFTIANAAYQTALGHYNKRDNDNQYAIILGNGTGNNVNLRSNALTVSWNGDVDTVGDINIASGKHYKINGTSLIDIFYPVGSYYETSDTTFDPNASWGGTWVEDSAGYVTVAQDTNDTNFDVIGETGGSKDAVVVSHTHPGPSHTHPIADTADYYLTINYGTTGTGAGETQVATGSSGKYALTCSKSSVDFKAIQNSGSGGTGNTGAATNAVAGTDRNLQPYIVVKRWHRTA